MNPRIIAAVTTAWLLFFPLSVQAAVGQACVNDPNCAPGERCLLSEEQKNDACVGNEPCQQLYGAQAVCRERLCVKVTGVCDLTAQPAGPGTATALPTLDATKPDLQIDIPDLKFAEPVIVPDENEPEKFIAIFPWIGEYVKAVYLYLVGIAGLVAVIVFIHAGFEWIASGGNTHAIEDAKKKILNASIGMVIIFGSYTILNVINPRLTRFEGIRVPIIKRVELDFASMETDVNPDGGFDIEGTPNYGFRDTFMYKQADPKWRGVAYGNKPVCPGGKDPGGDDPDCCSSYAYSACGPTSLAMVLRTQGVATNPVDAGAFATEIGARKCNQGTTGELFKKVGERWDNFEGKAVTHDQALKILKAKTTLPIIASTPRVSGCYKKGGHWIVLTGIDENGLVRVNDSGTGKCFTGRNAGDGFYGSKGAGLTAMTQENFRSIPALYVVVSKDKAFATKADNPEVFEILAPLFTFDFF